jgi:predicted Zn-dependent protease
MEPRQANQIASAVMTAANKLDRRAEVHVAVWSGRTANTRFARNEVTSCGDAREDRLSVTVQLGKRHATASFNQTAAASLREVVEHAYRMAKVAPEDPESMPVLGPQKYAAVPPAHDAALERLSAMRRAAAVRVALNSAQDGLAVAGFVEHTSGTQFLATSAGARGLHRSTAMRMSATARTSDGTGSGWAAAASHRASEVDPPAIVQRAVDKAVRSKAPRALEPGRYTVVLEPAAVAELISFLQSALGAREADEGRSFFGAPGGNKIGQKLFSECISFRSDPCDLKWPRAPFDADGLALEGTTWIEQGRISALRYTRFWAQKQGKRPTGRHDSFALAPGEHSAEQLITGVKKGLLVTRFWYSRWLDPQSLLVTGLTRDGLFLIENGQVTSPVNNFRYNESIAHVLKKVDAVGKVLVPLPVWRGTVIVPAIRAHEFHMASISEAV